MIDQYLLEVATKRRGLIEITDAVADFVAKSAVERGLCHLMIQHTSASLIITENADPTVLRDMEYYMAKAVQDGDPRYQHAYEGPDDMSAHIRSVLTATTLSVPVMSHQLQLGTWQGIFVWEHRTSPHCRRVLLTLSGD